MLRYSCHVENASRTWDAFLVVFQFRRLSSDALHWRYTRAGDKPLFVRNCITVILNFIRPVTLSDWFLKLQVYSAAADLVDIAGYGAARNLLQATLQASVSELMPDAASTGKAIPSLPASQ